MQGAQGPFIFPGWRYDVMAFTGPRAIYILHPNAPGPEMASFNVTTAAGIALANISVGSYTTGETLDITGRTVGGATPTPVSTVVPPFPYGVTVTLDASWQGIYSVMLATQGLQGPDLYGLTYS